MKFEEVLPAWRSGRKVRRKGMSWWLEGKECRDEDEDDTDERGDVLVAHLLADDWEVVEDYEDVEVWDWVGYNEHLNGEIHKGKTQPEMEWVMWGRVLPGKMAKLEGTQRIERRKK
jgi:hypothetical protein